MDIRKTLWLANLALFALLAYTAAAVFVRPVDARMLEAPGASATEAPLVQALPESLDDAQYAAIMDRNVFGAIAYANESPEGMALQSSTSPLRLKLLGTVAGDEAVARALIEDEANQKGGVYRTGDTVQDARILRIERSRVVLERESQSQVIELKVSPLEAAASASKTASSPGVQYNAALGYARMRAGIEARMGQPTRTFVDQGSLYERHASLYGLLRSVQTRPYMSSKSDQPAGIILTGMGDMTGAEGSGLQRGDVILEINGEKITDVGVASQVLDLSARLGVMYVKILRGGQEMLYCYRTGG